MLPLPVAFIDGRVGVSPTHSTNQDPPGTGLTLPSLGIPGPHLSPLLALGPRSPGRRLEPALSCTGRWMEELSPWRWDCWAEGIPLSQDTSGLFQGTAQGLLRLAWLSTAVLAARLFRWCGKVGISSGSQAVEHRQGSAGPTASQPCPAPARGVLTQGLLLEVGTLQAVLGRGPAGETSGRDHPSLGDSVGQVPALLTPHPAWLLPFLGVIHEEEVEQSQPSL